jgi:signal transduction histidine kinase/CheY-like chemotaxis protein
MPGISLRSTLVWLAVCWMLAILSASVTLAATIAVDTKAESMDLSNSMTLLHDPTGKLHFTEVLSMQNEFVKAQRKDLVRSFNAGVFWLRFSLVHAGAQPVTRWLVVGTPKINTVTLFLQSSPDWQVMNSGRNVPLIQRPILATDAAFPVNLVPGQNREVLVRVVARGATDMATTLWEPQAYRFASGERKLLLVGMLTGVLVSSALSLIVLIRLREMQYLWMSLFLLAIVGVELARENLIGFYFWPGDMAVPLQILSVFGGLAVFALSKVISHALDLPRHFEVADKVLMGARWLAVAAVVLSGFDYGAGVRLLAITAIIVHVGGLILPAVLWRRGIASVRWFSVAFGLGLLLETLRQLANLGILPWATAMNFSLGGYLLAAPFILVGMIEQTRQLSEKLAVATQLQEAKSAFLARVSHELRSPLNTILGFARMLQRGSARLSLREGTSGIEKGALRLLDLIDELLDQSRAAAGKLAVSPAPTLFLPWFDELCESAHASSEAQGNRFLCERSGELPAAVTIDSARLRQVLENFLNNANRHTTNGEILLQCSAWSENVMAVLNFAVTDTGEGIPPDQLNDIFEPFVRGNEDSLGDRRRRSGFGLGLSISRELVRQMGGEISVSSKLKQGSRFSFTLRCRRVDPAAVPIQTDIHYSHKLPRPVAAAPVTTPVGPTAAASQEEKPSVLVVDDDPQQLQVLGDLLDEAGMSVKENSGGFAAMEQLKSERWDAVITDQMMANGDGWYLLRQSRGIDQTVPVMLLSAAKPMRPDGFPDGINFDAVLQKPSMSEDLLATLWGLILNSGAPQTTDWKRLATLASDGDISGIEDWIADLGDNTPDKARIAYWARHTLHRLNLGLLERVAGNMLARAVIGEMSRL